MCECENINFNIYYLRVYYAPVWVFYLSVTSLCCIHFVFRFRFQISWGSSILPSCNGGTFLANCCNWGGRFKPWMWYGWYSSLNSQMWKMMHCWRRGDLLWATKGEIFMTTRAHLLSQPPTTKKNYDQNEAVGTSATLVAFMLFAPTKKRVI